METPKGQGNIPARRRAAFIGEDQKRVILETLLQVRTKFRSLEELRSIGLDVCEFWKPDHGLGHHSGPSKSCTPLDWKLNFGELAGLPSLRFSPSISSNLGEDLGNDHV